jgi:hypothetical protein
MTVGPRPEMRTIAKSQHTEFMAKTVDKLSTPTLRRPITEAEVRHREAVDDSIARMHPYELA